MRFWSTANLRGTWMAARAALHVRQVFAEARTAAQLAYARQFSEDVLESLGLLLESIQDNDRSCIEECVQAVGRLLEAEQDRVSD